MVSDGLKNANGMTMPSANSTFVVNDDRSVRSFKYATLADEVSDIRIVRVLSELRNGLIVCTIHHASIHDAFIALSYNWGDDKEIKTIWMNDRRYKVRQNLFNFLRCAYINYAHQPFWIDALSIDQLNATEKNHRVKLMSSIYQNASAVFMWLDSHGSSHGMISSMKDVTTEKLKDFRKQGATALRMLGSESPCDVAKAYQILETLAGLMKQIKEHPYWSRLWVVQEILLGKRKSILYNNWRIPWELFTVFDKSVRINTVPILKWINETTAMETDFVIPSKLFDAQFGFRTRLSFRLLSFLVILPRNVINAVLRTPLTTPRDGMYIRGRSLHNLDNETMFGWNIYAPMRQVESLMPGYIPLLDLIDTFMHAKCSDPRDKIYGLLSICKERSVFPPDYKLNVYEVFFKTVEYATIDALQSNELSKGISRRLSTIVQSLMSTLELGPFDMLLCDKSGRTRIVYLQGLQKADPATGRPRCRTHCEHCNTTFFIHTVQFGAQRNAILVCFHGLGYFHDKSAAHVVFHRDEIFGVHLTSGANELAECYKRMFLPNFVAGHVPSRPCHMGSLLDAQSLKAIDIADLQVNCGNKVLTDSRTWEFFTPLGTNRARKLAVKRKTRSWTLHRLLRRLRTEQDDNHAAGLWHRILPYLEFEKGAWISFLDLICEQYPSFLLHGKTCTLIQQFKSTQKLK